MICLKILLIKKVNTLNSKNKIVAVIPARYSSSRFPGKPLALINGKSMIRTVYDNIKKSDSLDNVFVATDDERIEQECIKNRLNYVITDVNLKSGTDRIAQAVEKLGIDPDIIINVQGDEPLINPKIITNLIKNLKESECDVGTVITKITDKNELFSDSVVKVVTNENNIALYFSRSTIPYLRDIDNYHWHEKYNFYKHIGIYAYTKNALKRFVELSPSSLEMAENLEQLRLLQDGAEYYCYETDAMLAGVDYPEDIKKIEKILND